MAGIYKNLSCIYRRYQRNSPYRTLCIFADDCRKRCSKFWRSQEQLADRHGGKVVSNINCPLAWEVGNVEKVSDALTVGFDTYPSATLDVMFGRFAPVGKLPLTLPKGDEVLAVNADGVCISPNDVPGFAKDAYMPDSMKDENGKAYAYRDAAGNYYEMNFGLTF